MIALIKDEPAAAVTLANKYLNFSSLKTLIAGLPLAPEW
jgi:hypothetical protein